jgi:hypothetical protein
MAGPARFIAPALIFAFVEASLLGFMIAEGQESRAARATS